MRLIARWIASALALLAVAYILPSIEVAGFGIALVAALVLGFINAVLGTVLHFVTKPLSCLTLGLFSLLVNAFLFWLASELVAGFEVVGAWAAILGALLYGLLAGAIAGLLGAK
jgi:putative membrane protein